MQWDDIRFFMALARAGSLSAAARTLRVEHSTVARRVANLEKALHIKLFDRLPRGWVLTDEGRVFFTQAQTLEDNILSLQRSALKDETFTGKIQLSAPPYLLSYFILPYLDEFKTQYPHIHLELIGERKNADMLRGEVDIALRMVKPNEQELIARKIADVPYALYATQAYLNRPKSAQKYIGFADSLAAFAPKKWLDEHVANKTYSLTTNDILAMYQAAVYEWGIALLPDFIVPSNTLIKIPTDAATPKVPLYLVLHPDIRRAPKVKALSDFIVNVMQEKAL